MAVDMPKQDGTASIPVGISPEALKRLVNLAEDGIISVTADQKIVLFNRGASHQFGYTPEEAIGMSLGELIPTPNREAHKQLVESFPHDVRATRAMAERRRVYGHRKDGSTFPAEVSISKFIDQGKLYLNAIVRDVTERVRIEEEILGLNRELEQRVRLRTAELQESNLPLARKNEENETFVYSVSHDLRSPLVNLEGFSRELGVTCTTLKSLIQSHELPESLRNQALELIDQDMPESIHYIHTAVSRLSGIIDALLRLSRAGRVNYEAKRVPVGKVVERVVQALRVTADAKKANVRLEPLPDAWADPLAVEQIFANLIGNALNYLSPDRPGEVVVGGDLDTNVGLSRYFIRDNGVGIQPQHSAQIFQAFRRLNPALAPGEGMGLVIVRRILDRIGGEIDFQSEYGQGTTFTLTLPSPSTDD